VVVVVLVVVTTTGATVVVVVVVEVVAVVAGGSVVVVVVFGRGDVLALTSWLQPEYTGKESLSDLILNLYSVSGCRFSTTALVVLEEMAKPDCQSSFEKKIAYLSTGVFETFGSSHER
jgi:flagellar motor component MotA